MYRTAQNPPLVEESLVDIPKPKIEDNGRLNAFIVNYVSQKALDGRDTALSELFSAIKIQLKTVADLQINSTLDTLIRRKVIELSEDQKFCRLYGSKANEDQNKTEKCGGRAGVFHKSKAIYRTGSSIFKKFMAILPEWLNSIHYTKILSFIIVAIVGVILYCCITPKEQNYQYSTPNKVLSSPENTASYEDLDAALRQNVGEIILSANKEPVNMEELLDYIKSLTDQIMERRPIIIHTEYNFIKYDKSKNER